MLKKNPSQTFNIIQLLQLIVRWNNFLHHSYLIPLPKIVFAYLFYFLTIHIALGFIFPAKKYYSPVGGKHSTYETNAMLNALL